MKIRLYAELAVAIALAAVLDLISKSLPLPRLPYGGSISLRALPILIVALRHGAKAGVSAGGVYGVVDFLIHPVFVHPMQLLLDYPIALGALGSAGLLWARGVRPSRLCLCLGIVLGCALRLAAHFVSGVVFFAQFAPPDQPLWLYSLIYNTSYLVPETIVLTLLMQLILRRMLPA
jgi:thiamine transporter